MKKTTVWPESPSDLLPPLGALVLVALFVMLGFWQLDRADQKRALRESFADSTDYLEITAGVSPDRYQAIRATGRYLNERQFLIDNMVVDGRLGYFVITPIELSKDAPLLLVNRGWIPKRGPEAGLPSIAIGDEVLTVTGRAGHLPRVGIRPGTALAGAGGWPKLATFPTSGELAAALARDVLPFVLLADPSPTTDLVRRWEPPQTGSMRHLAYAFQWFALAITVVAVTAMIYRKKWRARK